MSETRSPAKAVGKPTLKTISNLSGLAVPTVSRALNDAPDISQETKKEVRRIASEIGYVPNRAGLRLRTGRTNVISLVLSTETDIMNHTARLISAIAGGLRGSQFHLNITPYFPDEDALRPIQYIVETGSADAVIFNQILPEDPRVAYLMERKFPFATHGRSVWSDDHAWFDFDNEVYGRLAVERLYRKGRRNTLMIAPPMDQNYSIEMTTGASSAASALGSTLSVSKDINSASSSFLSSAHMAELFSQKSQIDSIICASTNSAMAVVSGMESAGLRVGEHVDIVAKEAIPFLSEFRRGIHVIQEDVLLAGDFLARAAMQAIRAPDLAPMQRLEVPTVGGFTV
ncbi:MAG: LacI family transcriptional regulator [Pseudomonadota bacterium]